MYQRKKKKKNWKADSKWKIIITKLHLQNVWIIYVLLKCPPRWELCDKTTRVLFFCGHKKKIILKNFRNFFDQSLCFHRQGPDGIGYECKDSIREWTVRRILSIGKWSIRLLRSVASHSRSKWIALGAAENMNFDQISFRFLRLRKVPSSLYCRKDIHFESHFGHVFSLWFFPFDKSEDRFEHEYS